MDNRVKSIGIQIWLQLPLGRKDDADFTLPQSSWNYKLIYGWKYPVCITQFQALPSSPPMGNPMALDQTLCQGKAIKLNINQKLMQIKFSD